MDDYNKILLQARRQVAPLRDEVTAYVVDLYARMLLQLRASGTFDADTAEQMMKLMDSMLRQYGQNFMRELLKASRSSAGFAANGHAEATTLFFGRAGVELTTSFSDVPTFALEHMQFRRAIAEKYGLRGFTGFFKTVIERNLKQFAADFDQILLDAVTLGRSASDTTLQIAKTLAMNEPDVFEVLKKMGSNGGAIRGAILDDSVEAIGEARSLLKKSKLIAVHEINTAYDEADKIASVRSPVVGDVRWTLSGRHSGLSSSPDVCNILAEADYYGLGAGIYPANYVPSLAHPRCLCSIEKLLRHPAMWNQEKVFTGSFQLIDADAFLADRGITIHKARTEGGLANKLVRAAFDADRTERRAA